MTGRLELPLNHCDSQNERYELFLLNILFCNACLSENCLSYFERLCCLVVWPLFFLNYRAVGQGSANLLRILGGPESK